MAAVEDMLFPHLDRLPPLRPGQRIERLAANDPNKTAAIIRFLSEFAGPNAAPPQHPALSGPRLYVEGKHGRIFARQYGDASSPKLVLLHDVPGTSLALHETAQTLAATHHVIIPDHPGCGFTEAPKGEEILAAAADNILAVADALSVQNFEVAASGSATAVAASLAQRHAGAVAKFLIGDIIPPDPTHAALVAPGIELSPTGAHWVQAWLMLRDAQIYRPWFDGRIEAQRATQGNFDAAFLHDQTAALMEGRATYFLLPRAASVYETANTLAAAGVPITSLKEELPWN
jgi:pimeloyl-ACP methyl ester carboxylesterase